MDGSIVGMVCWELVVVVSDQRLLEANPVAWGGRQCDSGLTWTLGREASTSLQGATGQQMAHMDIYIYIYLCIYRVPIKLHSAIFS